MFLYKNKQNEVNCSMPDPDDDPISFDYATEEVIEAENEGAKEEKEELKKMQEAAAIKAVEDLKAQMAKEEEDEKKKIAEMED